ncbi:hypothetical protein EMCRGX_G013615 [Ephydatia muelleri]
MAGGVLLQWLAPGTEHPRYGTPLICTGCSLKCAQATLANDRIPLNDSPALRVGANAIEKLHPPTLLPLLHSSDYRLAGAPCSSVTCRSTAPAQNIPNATENDTIRSIQCTLQMVD